MVQKSHSQPPGMYQIPLNNGKKYQPQLVFPPDFSHQQYYLPYFNRLPSPYAPCIAYLPTFGWFIYGINVGKYSIHWPISWPRLCRHQRQSALRGLWDAWRQETWERRHQQRVAASCQNTREAKGTHGVLVFFFFFGGGFGGGWMMLLQIYMLYIYNFP